MATNRVVLILEAVDRASGTLSASLARQTRSLQTFSRNSAQFAGGALRGAVAIGTPLAASLKTAIDFEDQMGNIATIVDTNTESMDAMGKSVLKLATDKKIPVGIDDMVTSLYDIRSAGITAGDAMGTLEDSSKLAVSGLSTVAEATDIMTSGMNAFKNEGLTSTQIADIFFKTTAYGKTTVAQMSQAFGANASIINAAGVKLADYSAATAALTTSGLPAAQAQNQLRAAVVSLTKPTADMQKVFDSLGVSTGEQLIAKFGSLGGAFGAVKGTSEKLNLNLGKVTGSVEAMGAILGVTGANNAVYTASLADMTKGSNALDAAFEKQSAKTSNRMKVMKNQVQVLGISIGNILLPALSSIVNGLSNAGAWMTNFSEKHPVLTKVIVVAAAGLAAFLGVLAVVGYTASAVSAGMAAMTTITTFLTSRIHLATAANWIHTASMKAANIATRIWAASTSFAGGAMSLIRVGVVGAITTLGSWISTSGIATAAQWAWNAAMAANPIGLIVIAVAAAIAAVTALVVYWDDLKAKFKAAPTWLKIALAPLILMNLPIIALAGGIRWLIKNWNELPGYISKGVNSVTGFFVGLWEDAKSIFQRIVDFVFSIPGKMFEAGKNIVSSIGEGMKSVAMAPINFISDITSGIRDFLPFSPAKKGALRDIHRIKLVETVAENIKPGPMVKAMKVATSKTMNEIPGSANANIAATGNRASFASFATGAKTAPPAPAAYGSGSGRASSGNVTNHVTFAPNITVTGSATGDDAQKMGDDLMKKFEKMMKDFQRDQERKALK